MCSEKTKNALIIIFGSMASFMVYLVVVTSMKSDMFNLPAVVVNEPWFQTTLVDFYFLVTILSIWVIYKERKILNAIIWIVAFICLGSIGAAFYVFVQLRGLKEGEGFEKVLLRKVSS
jgi:membrane-bound acyltransferase YfiQ involved in biofilm formation